MEVSTSQTGKPGHAKAHIVALDIFTGKALGVAVRGCRQYVKGRGTVKEPELNCVELYHIIPMYTYLMLLYIRLLHE